MEIWEAYLTHFKAEMHDQIEKNIPEKCLSWRISSKEYLENKLQEYAKANRWVAVANIAFMLWENEKR